MQLYIYILKKKKLINKPVFPVPFFALANISFPNVAIGIVISIENKE